VIFVVKFFYKMFFYRHLGLGQAERFSNLYGMLLRKGHLGLGRQRALPVSTICYYERGREEGEVPPL
jgi:hypothetical protein